MADVSSLHCPNCGAAVDPDAGRCPYCKARLATVSCPSCFALMFDGAAFCPACGARAARLETGEPAGRCPACRGNLQLVALNQVSLLECASCDGVWVDAGDFERICVNNEAQAAVVHRFSERTAVPTERSVRYRPCVRCAKMMNRINFGRLSGTVVDVCRGHGTFLDAGELHQIVAFIRAGGLERARERQLAELKEEERRLKNMERRAAHERGANEARSPSVSWNADSLLTLIDAITHRK
jgi:Zn-finger nucleic acid-binding protein/RNA polymerase subunit RPABC4/transcription elongation factor Spt4